MAGLSVWLLAAGLLACGDSTESDAVDCQDPDCRQRQIMEIWPVDQASAIALIEGLPDEIERVAAVSRLVDLYPAEVAPLCQGLPEGASKERCLRAGLRAHLHVALPLTGAEFDRSKLPPTVRRTIELLDRDSPLAKVPPDASKCRETADPSACLLGEALQLAQGGDARGAAALCHAVPLAGEPEHRWRSECFFGAAEHRLKVDRDNGYADAVDLCTAGKLYGPFCIKHLLDVLGRAAPAADRADAEAWAEMRAAADDVRAVWKGRQVEQAMLSAMWAVTLSLAVNDAKEVTGDALDYIPADMAPHLRASAAARLLREAGADAHDLEGWVDEIESALKRRVKRRSPRTPRSSLEAVGGLWPRSDAEAAGLEVIPYRGAARRVVAAEPRADLAICVLEAAARMNPVPRDLLTAGQAHADPAVQWTATKLGQWAGSRPPKPQRGGAGVIP